MSSFDSPNKSSNKRKLALIFFRYSRLFTIVLLLFIFVLSYLFVIGPKYKKMKKTSEYLTGIRMDELNKLETYLERLKNFNKSYKNVSELDRERMNKIIPSTNNYEDLLVEIEDIVNNRGLVLRSVSIKTSKRSPNTSRAKTTVKKEEETNPSLENIEVLSLSLEINEVDYDSMKELLSDFEMNLRLIDVDSVDFSNGGSVSLDLKAYYFSL